MQRTGACRMQRPTRAQQITERSKRTNTKSDWTKMDVHKEKSKNTWMCTVALPYFVVTAASARARSRASRRSRPPRSRR